jgi:hypothetical protein
MYLVGIYYTDYSSDLAAQITRDLLALSGEFKICVLDPGKKFDVSLLNNLGISLVETGEPDLAVAYKLKDTWPEVPQGVTVVERNLKPDEDKIGLSQENKIGYYVKKQGRDGPNLTERYLNRAYPKGRGFVDPSMYWMY